MEICYTCYEYSFPIQSSSRCTFSSLNTELDWNTLKNRFIGEKSRNLPHLFLEIFIFCSITDRLTYQMLMGLENLHTKISRLS